MTEEMDEGAGAQPAYEPPSITDIGTLKDLTAGKKSTYADSQSGQNDSSFPS